MAHLIACNWYQGSIEKKVRDDQNNQNCPEELDIGRGKTKIKGRMESRTRMCRISIRKGAIGVGEKEKKKCQ